MLLSSHVLSEVEAVCERVAIVRQGEIVALETIQHLREKVVRKLTVRFHGAPPDLTQVPGVLRSETVGLSTVLSVHGELGPILTALANAHVQDLVFPEPELEDIFLSYYGGVNEQNA